MNRLEAQLALLVEQQVLSAAQAADLVDAARADRLDGQSLTAEPASDHPKGLCRSGGPGLCRRGPGAGCGDHARFSFFWDDLGSTGRKLVAVASSWFPALEVLR